MERIPEMTDIYVSRKLSYYVDGKQLFVDENELFAIKGPKIILGEPGMGKSSLIDSLANMLGSKAVSANRFMRRSNWLQKGMSESPLLIDSFDEAISNDEYAAVDGVLAQLEGMDHPDFILACRAREWPDYALSELGEVYREQAIVFYLEPLSRSEAERLLAELLGVNLAVEVLEQMDLECISELYQNPLTLKMIGEVAKNDRQLPSSRADLFERVCRLLWVEHNKIRAVDALRQLSAEEVLDMAGALMAGLLLSGKEAIGLARPTSLIESDIALAELSVLIDREFSEAVVRCKLFNGDGLYRAKPIHRVISEYLGARWLSRQVDDPRKQRRLLAQFQGSGRVPASFRGLHAWLAVHKEEIAGSIITADPFGVVLYADVTVLATSQKKHLLKTLRDSSKSDPYLHNNYRKGISVKGMMLEVLSNEIESIIGSGNNSDLISLLLDGIRGTSLVSPMKGTLCDVMLCVNRSMHERYASAVALEVVCSMAEWEIYVERLLLQATRDSSELAYLIIEMHGFAVRAELLVEVTLARLGLLFCEVPRPVETVGHRLGEYASLPSRVPSSTLKIVLDLLSDRIGLVNASDFSSAFEIYELIASLVGRAIDEKLVSHHNPEVIWGWLALLTYADRNGPAISSLLHLISVDQELRRAVQYHALFGAARKYVIYHQATVLEARLVGLTADDYVYFISLFARFSNLDLSNREDWQGLIVSAAQSYGISSKLREASLKFEAGCPDLTDFIQRRIELLKHSAAESQGRTASDALQKRRRKILEKRSLRCKYQQRRDLLREGDLLFLELPARHYLGEQHLFHAQPPALERLNLFWGKSLARDVLTGFKCVLYRPDFPSPKKVARELSQNLCNVSNYSIFSALLYRFRESLEFSNLSLDVLKVGLLLCYSQGFIPNQPDRQNLTQKLEAILLKTESEREAFARLWLEAAILGGRSDVPGIIRLITMECWRATAIKLAVEWLSKPLSLDAGVEKKFYHFLMVSGESCRLRLIANDRVFLKADKSEVDLKWLALKVLIDFESVIGEFHCQLKVPGLIWHLRDVFTIGHSRRLVDHSISQAEWIVSQFRCLWPVVSPDNRLSSSRAGEASAFIALLIERVSQETTENACMSISRLVTAAHDTYSDLLKHAQASQIQKNSEEMFKPIRPEVLKLLLQGGPPCNAEDLKTLILEELAVVQRILIGDEFDPVRVFWADNKEPREENRCRDHLAEMLRPRLERYNVSLLSEADMPEDKRVDLAFRCGNLQLPLEVKGQWHPNVWHAASSQLDKQYLIDWRSEQCGIFCVLWFGVGVSNKKLPVKPPQGMCAPRCAEEMQSYLAELIPQERRGRIQVVVIDLSARH
ncbi:hypothetical protein D3C77_125120 [compost metagenome]